MVCPKCMRSEFVIPSGESHYICRASPNEDGISYAGCGSQFLLIQDSYPRFPYNVIFMNRGNHEFFRKPYLQLAPLELSTEML